MGRRFPAAHSSFLGTVFCVHTDTISSERTMHWKEKDAIGIEQHFRT
jgi:hypothetical protein